MEQNFIMYYLCCSIKFVLFMMGTGVCVISQEMLMESNTNECNAKDDQCKMSILTLEHNTNMRLVESSATDVEARKVITLLQYMLFVFFSSKGFSYHLFFLVFVSFSLDFTKMDAF